MGLAIRGLALASCLFVFAAPAYAKGPPRVSGGYEITVSGTATLRLDLEERRRCGNHPRNEEIVHADAQIALLPKSGRVSRALVSRRKRQYGPRGVLTGFSLDQSVDMTYDDYNECSQEGSATPPEKSCQARATTPLSTRDHVLVIGSSRKWVYVSMVTSNGLRHDDHFPLGFPFCAGPIDLRPVQGTFKRIPFAGGSRGTAAVSGGMSFGPLGDRFELPYGPSFAPARYRGEHSYELRIEWRRVRRAPGS